VRHVPAIAAACALAVLAAPPARAEDGSPATLVAGLWPDSALVGWSPSSATAVRAPQRLPGIASAGTFAGGLRQSTGRSVLAGRATASLRLPITERLSAELLAGFLALDGGPAADRRTTRTEARLRLGTGSRYAWLGGAFERDLSGGQLPGGAMLALGVASQVRSIAVAAALEQTAERVRFTSIVQHARAPGDTVSPPVTTLTEVRFSTATNARLTARWARDRVAIESVAGLTLDRLTAPRRWTQTSASVAVTPHLALFGTLGNAAPRWLALDAGFERRATLGMRLTSRSDPAAVREAPADAGLPRWRLRHLGQDWYVIEIHAHRVQTVSIMGDFTEWGPMALKHVSGDRWGVATRLAPGVHRVQARLDGGEWLPPAGLASTADGYNGAAGVFVAE